MISEVYNMDCMEYLKTIPDKFFDLAVVDPPYGINAPKMTMGTNMNRKKGGYNNESVAQRLRKGRFNQGAGKLKNRVLNTMNCDWDFSPPTEEYFCELERVSKNRIIWGGNSGRMEDCTCRHETFASYEKEKYNEEVRKLRQEIKELEKENAWLNRIIKKLTKR